jgi:hypothetical protein
MLNGSPVNIYMDESGDVGDTNDGSITKNFVVGCLYFPSHSYDACNKLIGPTLMRNVGDKNKERKGFNTKAPPKMKVLRELVNHGCRFGLIHINKEMTNYTSISKKIKNRDSVRANMILNLLESVIKKEKINDNIDVHIDKFGTKTYRGVLKKYLKNSIEGSFGTVLNVGYPESKNNFGIKCADYVCNSYFKKVEKDNHEFFNVIEHNIFTLAEIIDANFLKT